jgi:lipopolysaccharide export LptBFGC system permease protein LptF
MQINMMEKEESEYITNRHGIWFNQSSKNENTIIRSKRVYLDNLLFRDVVLITTVDNEFNTHIVADSLRLSNNKFILKNAYITKKNENIQFLNTFEIDTKLTDKFLRQKIQNEYQNIDAIPFVELNEMIKNFKESGLDNKKFIIKKINYLLMPFIYVLMVMLSGVFACSLNNRLGNTFAIIGITILSGLVIFIFQNILFELGNAGIINIFYSTFFPIIVLFLVILISMINKIELQNF